MSAAAPLPFQTLLHYQTPRSWKNISLIARCEWLAEYAVTLEVAAFKYFTHYLDYGYWKKGTWVLRWNHCWTQNYQVVMVALLLEAETHPSGILVLNRHMLFENRRQNPEVRKRNDQLDMERLEIDRKWIDRTNGHSRVFHGHNKHL